MFVYLFQVGLFHALGLVPICNSPEYPPGLRRVVLLVPPSGLSLVRALHAPVVSMCLSQESTQMVDHFMSVHMALVRVRRVGNEFEDDGTHWNSLSKQLEVRDTRDDDPDAELMVSAIVPACLLRRMLQMATSSMTHVQLRQGTSQPAQGSIEGPNQPSQVFYDADLANKDRTAIITPDRLSWTRSSSSPPPTLPERGVSSRFKEDTPASSVTGESCTHTRKDVHVSASCTARRISISPSS